MILAGPAFVASVAYVDPGNIATNSVAGATSGYALAWVVVAAGLMAMPVQYVAAKVGIVTGRSLPRTCRQVMSRPARVAMWLQAEVVAMATDVAEFLGAAVGLNLLFGLGLLPSGLITAVIAFGVLALQRRGHRPFEVGIVAFLAFVVAGVGFQLALGRHRPRGRRRGARPRPRRLGPARARGRDRRGDRHAARDLRALRPRGRALARGRAAGAGAAAAVPAHRGDRWRSRSRGW